MEKNEQKRDLKKERDRWNQEEQPKNGGTMAMAGIFLAICTLFVTGLLRGPLLIAAIGLTVTALVRRGKFQGLAVVSLVICAYSLFSMIQLAIFLGAAGTAGGGFGSGWMDARQEEVSEEERPREEAARGENEETEMEETTEAERNLEEHISLQETVLPRQLLFLGTNENNVTVSGEISVIFYDEAGQMLSLGNMYINNCPPGGKIYDGVYLPRDRNGQNVPYDHYEINLQVEERSEVPGYEYLGDQLMITANVGVNGNTLVKVENPTGQMIDQVELVCLYDQQGEIVGYESAYLSRLEDQGVLEFPLPRDENYQEIPYDDFEIVVVSTVRYGV